MNYKKNIEKEALYWIEKERDGFDDIQKSKFNFWINQSQEHKKVYTENKYIINLCKGLPKNYQEDLKNEACINKLSRFTSIKPFAVASIFLIILSTFIYNAYYTYVPTYKKTFETHYVIANDIKLPDNSYISLDAQSHVDIRFYKHQREVNLEKGKAYFEVKSNLNRPFIIKSGQTKIEVVGTKFEVIKENKNTQVKVYEGIVKLMHIYKNNKSEVIRLLKKGETISLNDNGKINFYTSVISSSIASWRNNILNFQNVSLQNVLKKFSNYYNIHTYFNANYLKNFMITGRFNIKEFDKFLKALPKIHPLNIQRKGDKLLISEKNKN